MARRENLEAMQRDGAPKFSLLRVRHGGNGNCGCCVDVQQSRIADAELSLRWVGAVLQYVLCPSRMSFCVLVLRSSGDLGISACNVSLVEYAAVVCIVRRDFPFGFVS